MNESNGFPTFLGIGVPKAGSSWLFELLKSHPEVWVPNKKTEVQYLTSNIEKGLAWYSRFFPDDDNSFSAIGEITPNYIYCNRQKISYVHDEIPTINKFILILRNPADRLWSHYKFQVRVARENRTFEEFMNDDIFFEKGLYYKYITRWLEVFSRSQFLILNFEDQISKPEDTKKALSSFLGIKYDKFPGSAGHQKVNESFYPYFPNIYYYAIVISELLHDYDVYWVHKLAEKVGLKKVLQSGKKASKKIPEDKRTQLLERYKEDIIKLNKITDFNSEKWLV